MPEFFEADTWYQDTERTIAFIALKGANDKVRNHSSTTTYEVISGSGRFALQEDIGLPTQVYPVKAGAVVRVPKGTIYQDQGDMVMIATSCPPFDPGAVEVIK